MGKRESSAEEPIGQALPATHWSIVLAAQGEADERSEKALEALCLIYWPAIYGYVRRLGYSPEDAQDLTQGFFSRVIEKRYFDQANRERGRFRSFLLAALKHYLSDEWDRRQAQKRGGHLEFLSIDDAETVYQGDLADYGTPDRAYDRRWALALMSRGMMRLEEEYCQGGNRGMFQGLKSLLAGGREAGFAKVAAQLGISEGAAKMSVQRLRRRYRELLREEVRHTISSESELGEELHYLLQLLSE